MQIFLLPLLRHHLHHHRSSSLALWPPLFSHTLAGFLDTTVRPHCWLDYLGWGHVAKTIEYKQKGNIITF